jgi:flagellar biosynthetic protein FliP
LFVELRHREPPATREELGLETVIPAFVISELRTAFQMGFVLYVPFLVIDMVVASVLMSMGMLMLPPVLISLPFKILLFVLVDGWHLVVRSLATSFVA